MNTGPNFDHAGSPVDWSDNVEADERFVPSILNAFAQIGVDIELCRWSADDVLTDQYAQWWNTQSRAIRRAVVTGHDLTGKRLTIRRRLDRGDGMFKAYARVNRTRPVVVRDAATA